MVLPIVASAFAGAGIKTVLDKTVLKKNDKEDSDDLCSANFVVSSDIARRPHISGSAPAAALRSNSRNFASRCKAAPLLCASCQLRRIR